MKTIIIDGRRELKDLPELWYTDGTDEANEWGRGVVKGMWSKKWCFVGVSLRGFVANGSHVLGGNFDGHTYITPSEFIRLVYEPWKESQKVSLPTNYDELVAILKAPLFASFSIYPSHINACIQLTNIMNFANDVFENDGYRWTIKSGAASCLGGNDHPIYFNSSKAAQWAYKTFPEIFKAYWNG
jgi:hypothetical protein